MSNLHEEEALGKAYDSRLMRRLLQYMKPYKWRVALALIMVAIVTPLELAPPLIFKKGIDSFFVPELKGAITEAFAWRGIGWLSLILLAVLVFDFLAQYIQIRIMQRVGQQTMYDMRGEIFAHMQRLPMSYFDRNPVGRLVTRVTTDVDALNDLFAAGVVTMINDFFLLAVMVGVLLYLNWRLALAALSVLPLIFVVTMVFRTYVREANRKIRTAIARINAFLQEYISGMSVVQIFNRESKAEEEFGRRNRDNMLAWRDAILAYALFYPAVEILSVAAIALIFWVGGLRILSGQLTLGVLVAFMQFAQRFFRPIQDLSEKFNILQSAMAAGERVFKLLDTPVDVMSPAHPTKPQGPGRVEFDHVWFAYRNIPSSADVGTGLRPVQAEQSSAEPADGNALATPDWVLRDVSFVLDPGETVAVVGHTGAGKTTLISLLMRFYDVQRGAIRIDGVDIKDMDLRELRSRFGTVLQDPFLFSGTVAGHIRLGTEWIEDADVERAAEEVNLADFIRTLPGGFKEEVRERGSTLSTGQKQLISFARALAHDPKILILDEATSSVDTETEFRVRDALNRMVEGR